MTIALESIGQCFQGLIPATIATCSKAGEPNVTFLSQVFYVDAKHVALSRQFFNKTSRNVAENPYAMVEVLDPSTLDSYRLRLRFLRSETKGPLYDAMSLRIQAIASITGMEGIFRLLSADVYEVLDVEFVETIDPSLGDPFKYTRAVPAPHIQLKGVHLLSQEICRSRDLDELLDRVLGGVEELFGWSHSMVLVPDDSGRRLITLASHGYGDKGVGAEVAFGEGFIGTVAEQRKVLRVSGIEDKLAYGRAIRDRAAAVTGLAPRPEIPLPGLPGAFNYLGLPLIAQDQLVGVLALESMERLAFAEWDEPLLQLLANQIALNIDRLSAREDEGHVGATVVDGAPQTSALTSAPNKSCPAMTFTFFRGDDCVFVDGEYLIRNVPGLILWKLLNEYQRDGRTEFTNRELRLDRGLKLPELRDNLESRLILLRKRLEQQCPDLRIVPVKRGRFCLEVKRSLKLVEKDSA